MFYILFEKIMIFFLSLFCFFNLPFFAAIILRLSLFRNKRIREKNSKKKIIVIFKSGGVSDVESAFYKKKSNVKIYFLNRIYLIFILEYFLKRKVYDVELFLKKNRNNNSFYKYQEFSSKMIKYFKLIFGDFSFISFNFIYHD